jgi:predicted small lipoprotein YifL
MRHRTIAIFLLTGIFALAGCGQTGRLYLPEEAPVEEASPVSEDKDTAPEQADKP